MAHVTISFNARRPLGNMTYRASLRSGGRYVLNMLAACLGGKNQAAALAVRVDNTDAAFSADTVLQYACAGLVISGGSGNYTITAGTFTSGNQTGGSDTARATALVTAVAASASALRQARATNTTMAFSFGGLPTAGQVIQVCGIPFTFRSTAAQNGEVTIGGSAAATATNLCASINKHPTLALRFVAVANSSVAYIAATSSATQPNSTAISSAATNVTASVKVPTVGTVVIVHAAVPGEMGNNLAVTGTGTGLTAFTAGSAGRAGSGSGGGATPIVFAL